MPSSGFSGLVSSRKVDVTIDLGNPFLNKTVDGFLKIGTVAASSVAVEETYHCLKKGSISKAKVEDAKNAMVGGAVTGALISAASNRNKDQIIVDAIRGGAVATAAEFLNYLT
ncbi:uncharacterized protein A4U43_C08F35160 [Asparagus officinalis]|nr:uncharacterized protein A4U43_C08F35160 [Asparagus officinalis]